MGVNCTAPGHLARLIPTVRRATSKPVVAYPNSGERYDAAAGRWLPGEPAPHLADGAAEWVALGARLVGGCCRTAPHDIRELRQRLLGAP